MNRTAITCRSGAMLIAFALAASAAHADRDRPRGSPPPAVMIAACGDCHLAFPRELLPVASWARLLAGLERHFGTDASLDPDAARAVSRYLLAEPAVRARSPGEPPQDRITRSDWFVHEHRRIDAATWTLPSVQHPSNCAACHPQAGRGDFDDDRLTVPAGASPAAARAFRH